MIGFSKENEIIAFVADGLVVNNPFAMLDARRKERLKREKDKERGKWRREREGRGRKRSSLAHPVSFLFSPLSFHLLFRCYAGNENVTRKWRGNQ